MDFLFFDIECANCDGGYGKICSFGYVLTDASFRVLEKRDVLVNPKANFAWKFQYGYPKAAFRAAPDFAALYETFRNLLEAPDRLVFGYSVANDIRFLLSDCDRYEKPCYRFSCYDVQAVYGRLTGVENQTKLETARTELGIPESECVHRSDEDAAVTMRVLAALCEREGTGAAELIARCPECTCRVHDFTADLLERTADLSASVGSVVDPPRKRYLKQLQTALQANEPQSEGVLFGRSVCVSKSLEEKDFELMKKLVCRVHRAGGEVVFSPRNCDVFVSRPGEQCPRRKVVDSAIQYGRRVKRYDFPAFLQQLGLNEETFADTDVPALGEVCPAKFRFERYAVGHSYEDGSATGSIADLLKK